MLVIVSSLFVFLFSSTLRGCLLQAADSLADRAFQPRPAPLQMRDDGGAHAWIPEFLQMIGDRRDRVAFTLRREELADLVGHHHQPVRRHAWLLRRDPGDPPAMLGPLGIFALPVAWAVGRRDLDGGDLVFRAVRRPVR